MSIHDSLLTYMCSALQFTSVLRLLSLGFNMHLVIAAPVQTDDTSPVPAQHLDKRQYAMTCQTDAAYQECGGAECTGPGGPSGGSSDDCYNLCDCFYTGCWPELGCKV